MSTASPEFQAKEFMFMVKLFKKKVDNKRNNKSQHKILKDFKNETYLNISN